MSSTFVRRIIFFFIVGAAVVLVSLIAFLGPVIAYRFGPPDLTATAVAISVRATEASLEATKAAVEEQKKSVDLGSSLAANDTWDGLHVEVLSIVDDAWPLVKAQNSNNDPPSRGKRMMMVTVKVTNVAGDAAEPIRIDASDFYLMGNHHIVYKPYGSETSCGVVPAELNGVVARGSGFVTGNICVQVPVEEGDFLLVYERFVGDFPAVYITLPENEQ
ncbi:MAG: hypothetical protein JXM69_17865 [Anaerolineae bacterium]|nr:hypothetical protein [Anaerolineae bacterium]